MIGDSDYSVSKLYGMLPASISGDPSKRTPASNPKTVRNVFVIGPNKKIKLVLVYPMTTRRNFDEVLRVIDSLQAHRQAQGGHAGELEARRGRDHCRLGERRRRQEAVSAGLESAQALHPHCPATEGVTRLRQPGFEGRGIRRVLTSLQCTSRRPDCGPEAAFSPINQMQTNLRQIHLIEVF